MTKEPTTYSHSRLNTFRTCPYQYKLRYIDKIRAGLEGIEAFMGSRAHEALETLYSELLKGKMLDPEELIDLFFKYWSQKMHDGVVIVRDYNTEQFYIDLGAKVLADYYIKNHPFNDGVTLGLELRVEIPLGYGSDAKFAGIVDRLVKYEDGRFEVQDYKTSGRLPKPQYFDIDRQLALYQIGIEALYPEAVGNTELVWHYLQFGKTIRSKRGPGQLKDVMRDTVSQIEEIEAATRFDRKKSGLCPWCSYKEICKAEAALD